MRTLIFEITWSGAPTATLEYVRDNLVDINHEPITTTEGRITLSWPASTETVHDIDWELVAPGLTLTNLEAKCQWKDQPPPHVLATQDSRLHRWKEGGRV